jgi:hypothetical protein
MKKQITRVSLSQNAKMMAAIYLVTSVPLAAIFALTAALSGRAGEALLILFVVPLVYSGLGYLGTLFAAWFYNVVAKRVGGFEFTTAEVKHG